MIGNIGKIVAGVGIGIAAIAGRKQIKNAASKVKNVVVDLFSGPDYSDKRAPHVVIDDLDTIEDYVYLKSDIDFVVHLSKRLEHDLRFILDYDDNERLQLGRLVGEASDCNVFGDDEDFYRSIDGFRIVRNKVVHGEGASISFKNRLRWTLDVFKLEEGSENVNNADDSSADFQGITVVSEP